MSKQPGNDSNQRQNKACVRVLNKDAMAAKIHWAVPIRPALVVAEQSHNGHHSTEY